MAAKLVLEKESRREGLEEDSREAQEYTARVGRCRGNRARESLAMGPAVTTALVMLGVVAM
jgi:DNA-directed RNA polymerase subunit F